MAKPPEDTRVPFTLRIPTELHEKLTLAAGPGKSLNLEILERLARSFDTVDTKLAELDQWSSNHDERIDKLEAAVRDLMEATGLHKYYL
jgi:hypothetical protein